MEDKIGAGEWIRTNKGHFAKVILVCSEDYYAREVIRATYKCDNGEKYDYKNINSEFYKGVNQYLLDGENIVKHSKNIIDLIEEGDYVNGILVTGKEGTLLYTEIKGIDRSGYNIPISQYGENIKTIVTKEQFKLMEYKVGV